MDTGDTSRAPDLTNSAISVISPVDCDSKLVRLVPLACSLTSVEQHGGMLLLLRGPRRRRRSTEPCLQVCEINKFVSLATKFVRYSRRYAHDRRNDRDLGSPALQFRDQRAEVAITREEHDLVHVLGNIHRANRKLDLDVALDPASPGIVGELFGWLGNHRVTIVIKPIEQRPKHLGRFSRTYRAFFGESPSDTVRRSAHG
jgi:hypothetical protein